MELFNHLVIVGGASRAGKTYLIDQIAQGKQTALAQQLGIPNLSSFPSMSILGLQRCSTSPPENLILHCDLCFQYEQDNFAYIKALVDQAKNPCLITLNTPISSLRERNKVRLKRQFKAVVTSGFQRSQIRFLRYLWRLNRLYQSPEELAKLFDAWGEEVGAEAEHRASWVLDAHKGQVVNAVVTGKLVLE